MAYKAIALGLNKRILVDEKDVTSKLLELYEKDPNLDYYVSIYKYSQADKEQFDKTKSLAGFTNLKTSTLVFDFDSKKDVNLAKKDAKTLVGRLEKAGFPKEKLQVSFSGNKGVHVQIELNKDYTKKEVDYLTNKFAGDLDTADKQIHDMQRILRSTMSKHKATGLFKTPITIEELDLPIEEVKAIAQSPDDSRWEMAASYMDSEPVALPVAIPDLTEKKKETTVEFEDSPDFSKNKTGLTHAKFALASGYFEEGERHEAVMILSATYQALGWPIENAYNNLKATIRQRNDRLGLGAVSDSVKQELWKEITSVYSPNWKGGTFSEDKNALLIKTKKRYNIQDKFEQNLVISLPQVNNIFNDFATNIDKNTLKLGIPSFDQEIRVTTSTLVALLAAPSAGKSSISFGILNSTSRDGIKSMFFSLDMAAPQVYQRLAQRHTGYSSDRLFKAYQSRDTAVIEKVETTLSKEYENVKFCFRGAMNVDIIKDAILKEKELTGEFPKLVVIDYLENVLCDMSSDPTIAKGFVARALKDLANEFAICILLLVQPAKVTGGPSEELNSYYNIKGSGLVAEAASQVITMHRPGFSPKNPEDDNYLTLTVVKNRMGQLGTFDYHWTGVTGAIRELTSEEMNHLEAVRKANAAEKAGKSDLL